jgi:hypothetical protein
MPTPHWLELAGASRAPSGSSLVGSGHRLRLDRLEKPDVESSAVVVDERVLVGHWVDPVGAGLIAADVDRRISLASDLPGVVHPEDGGQTGLGLGSELDLDPNAATSSPAGNRRPPRGSTRSSNRRGPRNRLWRTPSKRENPRRYGGFGVPLPGFETDRPESRDPYFPCKSRYSVCA